MTNDKWTAPKASTGFVGGVDVQRKSLVAIAVNAYARQYNEVRLHSAIGYVTPLDNLLEREEAIFAERDGKIEAARERRRANRARQRAVGMCSNDHTRSQDRVLLGSGHRP